MTIEKQESLLLQEGFKKIHFSDKSAYWFTKKINKSMEYYADPELGHYNVDVITIGGTVETIKSFKTLGLLIKSSRVGQLIV